MKRLLIFTALYPPVALAVFTAPDGFKNFLDWLVMPTQPHLSPRG